MGEERMGGHVLPSVGRNVGPLHCRPCRRTFDGTDQDGSPMQIGTPREIQPAFANRRRYGGRRLSSICGDQLPKPMRSILNNVIYQQSAGDLLDLLFSLKLLAL